jgi:hypothetical protein
MFVVELIDVKPYLDFGISGFHFGKKKLVLFYFIFFIFWELIVVFLSFGQKVVVFLLA